VPDDHRFDRLELHAFPPWPAEAVLYDDDGISRAYQRGEYATTRIEVRGEAERALVSIGADEGRYAGQPEERRLELVLHRTPVPRSVRRDGEPWSEWSHDPSAECVRVRLAAPTRRKTRIEVES
jgi:hypothetical protein